MFAHSLHQRIQTCPSGLGSADYIAELGDFIPASTAAVVEQFQPLRLGGLIVGANAVVEGDLHAARFFSQARLGGGFRFHHSLYERGLDRSTGYSIIVRFLNAIFPAPTLQ